MCWKIIAIITENARNNTRKNNILFVCVNVLKFLSLHHQEAALDDGTMNKCHSCNLKVYRRVVRINW
jgi:hypothetical protein